MFNSCMFVSVLALILILIPINILVIQRFYWAGLCVLCVHIKLFQKESITNLNIIKSHCLIFQLFTFKKIQFLAPGQRWIVPYFNCSCWDRFLKICLFCLAQNLSYRLKIEIRDFCMVHFTSYILIRSWFSVFFLHLIV